VIVGSQHVGPVSLVRRDQHGYVGLQHAGHGGSDLARDVVGVFVLQHQANGLEQGHGLGGVGRARPARWLHAGLIQRGNCHLWARDGLGVLRHFVNGRGQPVEHQPVDDNGHDGHGCQEGQAQCARCMPGKLAAADAGEGIAVADQQHGKEDQLERDVCRLLVTGEQQPDEDENQQPRPERPGEAEGVLVEVVAGGQVVPLHRRDCVGGDQHTGERPDSAPQPMLALLAVGGEQGRARQQDHCGVDGALQRGQHGLVRGVSHQRIQPADAHCDPGQHQRTEQCRIAPGGAFSRAAQTLAERHEHGRLADGDHRQEVDQLARWLDEQVEEFRRRVHTVSPANSLQPSALRRGADWPHQAQYSTPARAWKGRAQFMAGARCALYSIAPHGALRAGSANKLLGIRQNTPIRRPLPPAKLQGRTAIQKA